MDSPTLHSSEAKTGRWPIHHPAPSIAVADLSLRICLKYFPFGFSLEELHPVNFVKDLPVENVLQDFPLRNFPYGVSLSTVPKGFSLRICPSRLSLRMFPA